MRRPPTAPSGSRPAARSPRRRHDSHPRIDERRVAVAREQGRRRLRRALVLMGAFSVAGAAWLLVHSPLLDVDHIRVSGARHETSDEVVRTARIRRGDALLLLRRGSAVRNLERLPWVEGASVRIHLPGTVRIVVRERTASAWVGGSGRVAVLDDSGRVLETRDAPPPGTVELRGVDAAPARPGNRLAGAVPALQVVAAAPPELRARVAAIEQAPDGWVAWLDGTVRVQFGDAEALGDKWAALRAVLDRLGGRRVASIDLRVPSAPAVLPEPAPAPTPTTAPAPRTTTTRPRTTTTVSRTTTTTRATSGTRGH